jgi:hypothetical protein
MTFMSEVASLVRQWRKDPQLELEARLGTFGQSGFQPGVPFSHFKDTLTALSKANCWTNTQGKHHFVKAFFEDDVRGEFGIHQKPQFVKKTLVKNIDIKCVDRPLSIRVSLKREAPVDPVHTKAHLWHLCEAWQLTYCNHWQYDFRKIASGPSKEEAANVSTKLLFAIELEVNRNIDPELSHKDIAENLLGKTCDLVGRYRNGKRHLITFDDGTQH